ncbi:MAG: thioredoxin-like domain-containing protein [Chthoniobacterales bacterium]
MRTLVLLLALGFVAIAAAGPQPLSNKEIALMLRSGYSSATILSEIASRHVLEPLDAATKKTLLEFGATPQLISVLEEGTFKIDGATAEAARQGVAKESARQEAQTEQTFRDATSVLKEQRALAPAAAPTGDASLMRGLRDKLIVCRDGTISHDDDPGLENKKLIALYFSAHWCAPCRKFTPQLVDYYNQVEPQHPEFEIVFVSCDRSRFNWETYMRDTNMPWPAIDFDQLSNLGNLRQIGGSGIPSLVLLDASGHVLSSSFDGENYLGPQKVLADLQKIFADGAGSQVAKTH